jgi:hypothetical protein
MITWTALIAASRIQEEMDFDRYRHPCIGRNNDASKREELQ